MSTEIGLTAKIKPEIDEREAKKQAGSLLDIFQDKINDLHIDVSFDDQVGNIDDIDDTVDNIVSSFETLNDMDLIDDDDRIEDILSKLQDSDVSVDDVESSRDRTTVSEEEDSSETSGSSDQDENQITSIMNALMERDAGALVSETMSFVQDTDSFGDMIPDSLPFMGGDEDEEEDGIISRAEDMMPEDRSQALGQLRDATIAVTVTGFALEALSTIKGYLEQISNSSPLLGGVLDILGLALQLFFRPFGNAIGTALLPAMMSLLELSLAFNKAFSDQGLYGALREMPPQIGHYVGGLIKDAIWALPGLLWDILKLLANLPVMTGEAIVGFLEGLFGFDQGSSTPDEGGRGENIGQWIGALIGAIAGFFFGPFGAIIGTALGAALGGFIGQWLGRLSEGIIGVFANFQWMSIIPAFPNWLQNSPGIIPPFPSWDTIVDAAGNINLPGLDTLVAILSTAMNIFFWPYSRLYDIFLGIFGLLYNLWDWFTSEFLDAIPGVNIGDEDDDPGDDGGSEGFWDDLLDTITGKIPSFGAIQRAIIDRLPDSIRGIASGIISKIVDPIRGIASGIIDKIPNIRGIGSGIISKITDPIRGIGSGIISRIPNSLTGIGQGIVDRLPSFSSVGPALKSGLITSAKNAFKGWHGVKGAITSGIRGGLKGGGIGGAIGTAIGTAIGGAPGAVVGAIVGGGGGGIAGALKGSFDGFKRGVSNAKDTMSRWSNTASDARETVRNLGETTKTAANSGFGSKLKNFGKRTIPLVGDALYGLEAAAAQSKGELDAEKAAEIGGGWIGSGTGAAAGIAGAKKGGLMGSAAGPKGTIAGAGIGLGAGVLGDKIGREVGPSIVNGLSGIDDKLHRKETGIRDNISQARSGDPDIQAAGMGPMQGPGPGELADLASSINIPEIEQTFSGLTQAVDRKTTDLSSTLDSTMGTISEMSNEGIATFRESTSQGIETFTQITNEGMETYNVLTGEGIEIFRESTAEGMETFREMTDEGMEVFREMTTEGMEVLTELTEEGREFFGELVEEGMETFHEFTEEGLEIFHELTAEGMETFHEMTAEGMESFRESIDDGMETLTSMTSDGMDTLDNLTSDGMDAFNSMTSDGLSAFSDSISDGLDSIADGISRGGSAIASAISGAVSTVNSAKSSARSAISSARSSAVSAVRSAARAAGLAKGGVVTGPTFAMIGEGKESEAVLPLSKLEGMLSGDMGGGKEVTGSFDMDVTMPNDLMSVLENSSDNGSSGGSSFDNKEISKMNTKLDVIADSLNELVKEIKNSSGDTNINVDSKTLASTSEDAKDKFQRSREITK